MTRDPTPGDRRPRLARRSLRGPRWGRALSAVVPSVLARPRLWPTALVVVARMARPGWWHLRPFTPVPDDDYWRFRMVTALGRSDAAPTPAEVVEFLEWYRSEGRSSA